MLHLRLVGLILIKQFSNNRHVSISRVEFVHCLLVEAFLHGALAPDLDHKLVYLTHSAPCFSVDPFPVPYPVAPGHHLEPSVHHSDLFHPGLVPSTLAEELVYRS